MATAFFSINNEQRCIVLVDWGTMFGNFFYFCRVVFLSWYLKDSHHNRMQREKVKNRRTITIMKKAVFYLFIVFSMALKGVSQQDVVIGTGTLKTSILPFCNSYNYSWTEMIYSASDIPVSGVISFISFYLS